MGQEDTSPTQDEVAEVAAPVSDAPVDSIEHAASALSGLLDPNGTTAQEAPEGQAEKPVETKVEETPTITFKIGDKDYSIPAKDIPEELRDVVKDGLLMRSDYTRKTQEVAEQRKAIEAEQAKAAQFAQTVQALPKHFAALEQVNAQLAQFQNPGLWQHLQQSDPTGLAVVQAKQNMQDLMNARNSLAGQLQGAHQQLQQQQVQKIHERTEAARSQLAKDIPDFSESKAKELREYARSVGVTEDQLDSVYDAAPLVILHKAMQFDALQKQSATVAQKVAKLPPKSVTSGVGSTPNTGPSMNQAAFQRLQRGGKVEDAGAVFSSLGIGLKR